MYILGIDPGTGRTGWGVIKIFQPKADLPSNESINKISNNGNRVAYVAHGCIVTDKNDLMPQRLFDLHREMKKIITQFQPKNIVIENIFFGRNSKTAISVGQARGVIILAAAAVKLPVFEYTSISVKHFLSGYGRTEKKDMQKIVRRLLNTNKRRLSFNAKDKGFDDSADALAIALFHVLKS